MSEVKIGVDPHQLSNTIEVVDDSEALLGSGRFGTDKTGHAAMLRYVAPWPNRVWAIEGANGAGRALAQRLIAAGERVVDVPAKLAARVRLFDTGHNRKTDAVDAHSTSETCPPHRQRHCWPPCDPATSPARPADRWPPRRSPTWSRPTRS